MFIKVKLLKGFQKTLTYKVPDSIATQQLVGKIVRVPIKNQITAALVLQQFKSLPKSTFTIRDITSVEPFPQDKHFDAFIARMGAYHQVDKLHFLRRMRSFLNQEKKAENTRLSEQAVPRENNIVRLTSEQQTVVDFLSKHVKHPTYQPTVLHGVTGSGKTEIYKQLIQEAIQQNKTAILLLPEVTLAIQFEKILQQQLPSFVSVFSFHSGTTVKNKKMLWQHLVKEEPILIIGVHLPILMPIANLGIIIVDEEHESGYQEKKHPKVNTKDAAIIRAHQNSIPILLGSATPSLPSLYNVKAKGWNFFQLKKRFSGTFPVMKTVFLSNKRIRRNFWISQELENEIRFQLRKKEQTIIFLNRRGFSFFVQCKACSFIFECPNCSVSLTLHKGGILTCHYCDYAIEQPQKCPTCKKDQKQFLKKGIGTQQVVTILEKMFPEAKICRADMDTTVKKKAWQKTMSEFENGEIDILVGTQTITKGFHFPHVTLVGILWADLNLHFPIFNATETTLQQLIQVAGRAGRSNIKSKVIVQAMSDHTVFKFLNEINYLKFYQKEIQKRKEVGYPPYKRLAEIELKNTNEEKIEQEATILATFFLTYVEKNKLNIQVLGPANPPVSKIKNTHIRKIYLKGTNITHMGMLFKAIDLVKYSSKIFFTPNPLNS